MASTLSKTINPQLVEVSFTNNVKFLETYSNYIDLVSNFKNELDAYFKYDRALYSCDFITDLKSFYGDLNGKYANFDSEFLIYYIKKYNALSQEIKNAVQPSIGKQNFLSTISDSIGMLTNTETMLSDFVEPLSDVNVVTYPAPYVYASNLKNKIRPTSLNIATDLSKQTTIMYRNNIVNVQFKSANSTEAHGSNLVTDFNSYRRARSVALDVTKKLSTDFGNLFKLVSYYGTLNDFSGYNPGDQNMNLQSIADVTYNLSVEGALMELDLMGKQIQSARKEITIKQVLMVVSQSQAKTQAQPINNTPNTGSTKPMPLNSTAPSSSAVINNPLRPNTTTTVNIPANNSVPAPVGYTSADRQKMANPIKSAAATVIAKPDAKVDQGVNFSTAKVSTQIPEYPRMPFAFAVTSPFGLFSAAKTVVCTLANLDISSTLKMKLPKLSGVFKKPDFKKFKNPLSGLLLKAQQALIKKLLALIPPLPNINALIASMKKQLTDALKKFFYCNPDNQN